MIESRTGLRDGQPIPSKRLTWRVIRAVVDTTQLSPSLFTRHFHPFRWERGERLVCRLFGPTFRIAIM